MKTGKHFVIVTCHPSHDRHDIDLVRLERALNKFYDGLEKVPEFLIWAGDDNTHFKGIHDTYEEQVAFAKKMKNKKGVLKYPDGKAEMAVLQKTWILQKDGNPNSINNILEDFLKNKGYSNFKDAAAGDHATKDKSTESKAKPDEMTCCCDLVKKTGDNKELLHECDPKRLKYSFDHILFAETPSAPVKSHVVYKGSPGHPSSDHLPLKLKLEWGVMNQEVEALAVAKDKLH